MIFMAIVRLPLHGQAGTISFTASRTAILCARFVDMEGGATYTNWRVPAASNADSSSCSCLLKTAAPSTYSFRRISPFLNAFSRSTAPPMRTTFWRGRPCLRGSSTS
uniref:Uncharacterized protein n=1 Tax=Cacopsylla melanoneura TaxID=428564 RepID=A0A8D8Q8X1_9HEMI